MNAKARARGRTVAFLWRFVCHKSCLKLAPAQCHGLLVSIHCGTLSVVQYAFRCNGGGGGLELYAIVIRTYSNRCKYE